MVKDPPANAGDAGDSGDAKFNPWVRRFPREGKSNPLQYSSLGSPVTEEPGGLKSMGLQSAGHD